MPTTSIAERLPEILRDTIVGTVRRDGPDLSARQFAVMLICYIEQGPHTVRGLAGRLDISKPAVTRSLDRLEELGLARRVIDPADRRSVLVNRTREGTSYLGAVRSLLSEAAKRSEAAPRAAGRGRTTERSTPATPVRGRGKSRAAAYN